MVILQQRLTENSLQAVISMEKDSFVLWVDDDIRQIYHFISSLKDEGVNVKHCKSIESAKQLIEQEHKMIKAVIIDIFMDPEDDSEETNLSTKHGFETGLELGRWIRILYPKIILIGCSCGGSSDVIQWFNEKGAGFIIKSTINTKNFVERVMRWLNLPSKQSIQTLIVHGRDEVTKFDLKNYLQNTLKLSEPIILHEQPSYGKTIIEKFESLALDIDFVFILLTPDDNFSGINLDLRRARQNVIFEMGYFYGKMNRTSGQVILLYKSPLEIPSDINGIIYIDITNGILSAGEEIRRELGICS